MRLSFGKHTSDKVKSRIKKKVRIRRKIEGTAERPRLCVFRSNAHIYAQVIDDVAGKTLFSTSSKAINEKTGSNKAAAKAVGETIAKKAIEKNITNVVFDRNGLLYHGRVQSLADGAREAGLKF